MTPEPKIDIGEAGWSINHSTWSGDFVSGFTEEKFEAFKAKLADARAAWSAFCDARSKERNEIAARAIRVAVEAGLKEEVSVRMESRSRTPKWGKRSLRDAIGPFLPPSPQMSCGLESQLLAADRLIASTIALRAKLAEKEKQAKAAAEADAALTGAVAWLQSRGKVLGTDFTLANAVAYADDIAFGEETKRLSTGEPIEFCGQNCDGPCSGWIPGDHRCVCGNRRVSWTAGDGHSFKEPYIYAEAY